MAWQSGSFQFYLVFKEAPSPALSKMVDTRHTWLSNPWNMAGPDCDMIKVQNTHTGIQRFTVKKSMEKNLIRVFKLVTQ